MKLIVVTAVADDAIRDQARAAGASGFFQKTAAGELVAAVERLWTEST